MLGCLVSGLQDGHELSTRRCGTLLLYQSARLTTCLRRLTQRRTLTHFNGGVFVHKLVRVAGHYHGGYCCYNVQGRGQGVAHCRLTRRRVLSYYRRNCQLNFHAFILRKNRTPTIGSRKVIRAITTVQRSFPSYTVALSLNRGSQRTCRHFFLTNTGHCLLQRRAYGRKRCRQLRPTRVSLSRQLRYLS